MNEVTLQGMVVGKRMNAEKKFCILTLATTKYENRSKETKQNYPKVFFSGNLALEAMKYEKFNHIYVKGKMEQYTYRYAKSNASTERNEERRQRVRGLSLKESSLNGDNRNFSLTNDRIYEPLRNEVAVAGKVIGLYSPNERIVLLTLQVEPKYSPQTFIKLVHYTDANAFKSLVKVKDNIYAVGSISTIEPDSSRPDRNLEEIVAKEIIKTNI